MSRSASREFSARDYIRAGILTAVIPVAGAFASYWLAPWGCDANAWICLLPIVLLYLAPLAALGLPVLVFINRRRRRPVCDSLIPVILLCVVVGQALTSGVSLWLNEPHVRSIFFFDVLIFPQGFVAGAIIGAVFWLSLTAFVRGGKADRADGS